MTPPDLELHIEELVLHGFAPEDRDRLGEALRQELTRLLAERGVPPSFTQRREVERLNAGVFAAAPGATPQVLGHQVARAIHGGLTR